MPQPATASVSKAEPPSHSPNSSPLSLFERRGLPAIKLTIPKSVKNSGIASHSTTVGGTSCLVTSDQMATNASKSPAVTAIIPNAAGNDSDIPSLIYHPVSSVDTRRGSASSLHSAKYSINSLLEDANPADKRTLTQLFALMDKLSMDIQLDLSR